MCASGLLVVMYEAGGGSRSLSGHKAGLEMEALLVFLNPCE